jgi:hypothetical protein
MRLDFHTVVPSAITLIGLVSALSAPASAAEADPASAVRGSLGVSLDELVANGAGAAVFLLTAVPGGGDRRAATQCTHFGTHPVSTDVVLRALKSGLDAAHIC